MKLLRPIVTKFLILFFSIFVSACGEDHAGKSAKSADVESSAAPPTLPRTNDELGETMAAKPSAEPSNNKEEPLSERELVEQILRKQAEALRAVVFNVPLDKAADKDRKEAWHKLTQEESWMLLSDEQLGYANELLKRYENGSQLEKLVFWRLVYLRQYEQGASSTSRIVGADLELAKDLRKRLRKTLYSGLGEEHANLSEPFAARIAIEIMEKAGKANP